LFLSFVVVGSAQNATSTASPQQNVARDDDEWEKKFAREFPEITEDSARINRGEKPQSELWDRTSKIYREMVAKNPQLANDRESLVLAARQAKRELAAEAPPKDPPLRLGATFEVFVAELGGDQGAAILRERVIGALVNRTNLRVVSSKEKAQTILAGAGGVYQGEQFSAGANTYSGAGGTMGSAGASGRTVFLTQVGLRLLDRNGNILWAFDPSKCQDTLARLQRRVPDEVECAVLQLGKAIERDQKTSGGH